MACWVGCRRRGLRMRREEVEGLGGYVCTDDLFVCLVCAGHLMDEGNSAGIDIVPA